jgi:hypothetical protein
MIGQRGAAFRDALVGPFSRGGYRADLVTCSGLVIAGSCFEVVGLGIVAYELWLIRRREFGPLRIVQWLRQRIVEPLRRLLGRSKPQTVEVGGGGVVAGGGIASAGVVRGKAVTVEGRLARLEQEHEDLRRELAATRERLEERIGAVERGASELRSRLHEEQAERDRERREQTRTTVKLQGAGTGLILVGVVLSVLGVALPC